MDIKYIQLAIFCSIVFPVYDIQGQEFIDVIASLNPLQVDTLPTKKSPGKIFLECDFSNSSFTELSGKDFNFSSDLITEVTLVYSQYKKSEEFNQIKLNKKRLENLSKLFPNIFYRYTVKWSLIEYTGCNSIPSCDTAFHGFIISYKEPPSIEEYESEISDMKRILLGRDPNLEEKSSAKMRDDFLDALPRYRGGSIELKKKINSEVKLALDRTNSAINKTTNLVITYEIGIDNRPSEIWIESNLDNFIVRFLKQNLMLDTCWQAGLKEGIPVNAMVTLEMQYDPDKGILTSERTFHVDDHRKSIFGNKDHYHINDNSILSILEKTSSNKNGIVVDVTGSMSPYLVQALIWVEKEINTGKVSSITFFNDGNYTPDPLKKIGTTGGIFHVQQQKDFDDIVETAITAMLSGNGGGDIPENNIEALIELEKNCIGCAQTIMIADNFATPRDLNLLDRLAKPVKIILCGWDLYLNPAYLTIALKTKGSIHIAGKEYEKLHELRQGDYIEYNGLKYILKNGKFEVSI